MRISLERVPLIVIIEDGSLRSEETLSASILIGAKLGISH